MTSSRSGVKLGLMKKLSLYIFLGLLFSLVTSQAISAGCKIPKKPKEKIVEAPEAVLKKQKILSNEGSDTQIIITKYLKNLLLIIPNHTNKPTDMTDIVKTNMISVILTPFRVFDYIN